jgi:O-antigen/teichoic acid export membrane protein
MADPQPPSATKHVRRRFAVATMDLYSRMVLGFISVAVLSRLLTPHELGIYSIGVSFVIILQSLRDFGVGRYLVQVKELTPAVLGAVMGITLTMGCGVAVILVVGAQPFADFYDEPGLVDLLLVLAINAILIPLNSPVMAVLERELRYRDIYVIRITSAVIGFTATMTLALLGFSYMSMAWGTIIGTLAMIGVTTIYRPRQTWVMPSFRGWGPAFSFGGRSTIATLAVSGTESAIDMVVGKVLDFAAVAQLGRGFALLRLFERAFVVVVQRVAFSTIAAMVREGRDISGPYMKASAYMTGLAWPFFGLVAVMADPVIHVAFGDQWGDAVPLVRIIAIGGAIGATVIGLNRVVMISLDRVGLYMWSELAVQAARLALIVPAAFFGLEAVAWAFVASKVVEVAVMQARMRGLLGIPVGRFAANHGRSLVVGIAVTLVALAAAWADQPGWPWWVAFAFAVPATLAGWVAAVPLARHPVAAELGLVAARLTRRR